MWLFSHGRFQFFAYAHQWPLRKGTLITIKKARKVADGALELLQNVFGKDRNPGRLVYRVANLPLGAPVGLELTFEIAGSRLDGWRNASS